MITAKLFAANYFNRTRDPNTKHQTPSSKLQGSSKSQASNQGSIEVVAIQGGALKFGGLEFLWSLELGAWCFDLWSLGFDASQMDVQCYSPAQFYGRPENERGPRETLAPPPWDYHGSHLRWGHHFCLPG
jgi:hypothetical protein